MYHIKLIKGLSYTGIVEATKKNPDIFVEDKATADKAVATGYFELVEDKPEQEKIKGHLDRAQLESMKFDDLKRLATDMGANVKGITKKSDIIEVILSIEVEAEAGDDGEDANEADYGEEQPGGSPTMIELQEQ